MMLNICNEHDEHSNQVNSHGKRTLNKIEPLVKSERNTKVGGANKLHTGIKTGFTSSQLQQQYSTLSGFHHGH